MNNKILMKFKNGVYNILRYYKKLVIKTKRKEIIGSINEWIVDNFYIITEQKKFVLNDYRNDEFLKIKESRKKELYLLLYTFLKEDGFKIEANSFLKKLNDYQKEKRDYFSYNEINFIHTLIRIILVSELNNLCNRANKRLIADEKINQIFKLVDKKLSHGDEVEIEKQLKISHNILNNYYYMEQLNYKLKSIGRASDSAFVKINQILLQKGISLKNIIKESQANVASDNLLMMNVFNSLKKIVKYELEFLYKNISYSEKSLINERVNIYDQMYITSKVQYRKKLIKLAKKNKTNEYEYVLNIVNKANKESKHVGWYLFKEKNINLRVILYIFVIITLTVLVSYMISQFLDLGIFLILLIPISGLVIEILNQLLMHIVGTRSLFRLKLEKGLSKEYSTMVTIATLIKDEKKVIEMLEKLEIYYLSNKHDNLYFVLLGDCSNEKVKDVNMDEKIVKVGLKKVSELNKKYDKKLFYFVYRNRFYSNSEEAFLGYERKRGALLHFNKLILNKLTEEQKNSYFKIHTFDKFDVPIKYVIVLDTDTKLVLNTAIQLIGAMAHPLNKPVLSDDRKKVIKGYGIMQPRIDIDVEVTNKSLYSQLFAGLGGLDIYTRATFDLYQDVFYEGSFVGKGIYDVAIFDEIISSAFPEELILSHDLIEGSYLRCGFISDIELFDDYPTTYINDAKRHHRWNRGDWQIISWLGNKVRNIDGEVVDNPISLLSKYKIFDNLRRSLMSLFLLLIIFYGLIFGVQNFTSYLSLVLVVISVPIFFYLISKVIYRNHYDVFLKYYLNLIRGILAVVSKAFVIFAVLPYEAYLYLDSIVRSIYRMSVSKRNLLNWVTAEEVEKTTSNCLISYIKIFKINYLIAILIIMFGLLFNSNDMVLVYCLAGIWFFAPFLIWELSRPIRKEVSRLNRNEKEALRQIACQTWKYFEDLLTEENNYLVPDNYQFNRDKKEDYKTSPTNIAFSLISIISVAHLKIINHKKAIEMISNILVSVSNLEKWNGLLYNWYNVKNFAKLPQYFVSTVDNGNFIASLYVVKSYLETYNISNLLYKVKILIDEMDFTKLYNNDLDVFSIGYNDSEKSLMIFNYNNFASESRLTSFIAIAKGDVPYKHWFCLDKTLTKYKWYKGVASWGGTAFEYFMPLIFMKTYRHTLLDEAYYYAYYAQKEFVRETNPKLPWGISESAYNELDDSENYKYGAFGVPYLKLLDGEFYPLIISPYSSIMALSIDDKEVYNNINKFKKLNMYGPYGFYEAYDKEDDVIVRNYYAHHQGMILGSIANYLEDNVIQNYFHSNKDIEAFGMLLKEKVQIKTYIDVKVNKYKKYHYMKEVNENDVREYDRPQPIPEIGVLTNGPYSVIINDRGVGFSKYKNIQINRYRKVTDEDYGLFLYIRNLNTNKIWSNTYSPLGVKTNKYKVIFASDRIKYIREDDGIVTTTEVLVVRDHNAELRKITFQNNTNIDITLEITSYGEVILARSETDLTHRIFNGLTIHSEIDHATSSLIFSKRSKLKENTIYYLINRLFLDEKDNNPFEYETSREIFIGRDNDVFNPEVINERKPLSNTVGSSLDSIMSIRKIIKVGAKGKRNIYLLVGFGKSKEQVLEIVNTYNDEFSVNKAFDMTTVLNNISTGYANLTGYEKIVYSKLFKYIFQAIPMTSKRKKILEHNKLVQSNLWAFGISGDVPIILVEIYNTEDLGFIKQILQAYEFYKNKSIFIDVVIINNEESEKGKIISNYIHNLMYQINHLNLFDDLPGSVYIISSSQITEDNIQLLHKVAVISLNASSGKSLDEQIYDFERQIPKTIELDNNKINPIIPSLPNNIDFYNEFGGFISNGKEYIINKTTPMPWINVIANSNFGTIINNNLGVFTYAYNSSEFKLTSWNSNVLGDSNSERLYINKKLFQPTLIKHGFGYTILYSETEQYKISITLFVGLEDAIKFYLVEITNKLDRDQSIDLTLSLKMVLGKYEEITYRYLYSYFNENCLYLSNHYNEDFNDVVVFLTATEKINNYDDANANSKSITVNMRLKKEQTKIICFMLGCKNQDIINKYKDIPIIKEEFIKVCSKWNDKLSVITVDTPDKSFNYLINGWYLYQTYSSRLLARGAFYQVGGAFGFRDQLQDILSVIYSDEKFARGQILFHAKHQFQEGDVLHWWHEEINFGIRTKFSDDYLWLAYITSEYIKITGDYEILNEEIGFVEGEKLKELEFEKGIKYTYSKNKASLYNHLKLCITLALNRFGTHNLPLIGSGDWNDGMNRVGNNGKGESVFVAFFLYDILAKMIEMAKIYNDQEFINVCLTKRKDLKEAINKYAWDGDWYLRAYYDDGDRLGSKDNLECKIDLLSQSWGILSEVADSDKIKLIIKMVEENLIDKDYKLIKLLTPSFKDTLKDPGYIKDYISGIRENGGQYNHAVLWYIKALLKSGEIDLSYSYYQITNPINRSLTDKDVRRYKVEPYVIAADIYSNVQHKGRGGWTWYTGSASWAYKIGIEDILGFKKNNNKLTIKPKIPSHWNGFKLVYRYLESNYIITVSKSKKTELIFDNYVLEENVIELINDKKDHQVIVNVGDKL